jgi:hypothetical protein
MSRAPESLAETNRTGPARGADPFCFDPLLHPPIMRDMIYRVFRPKKIKILSLFFAT